MICEDPLISVRALTVVVPVAAALDSSDVPICTSVVIGFWQRCLCKLAVGDWPREDGRTPGGSRKTPMTVKMDVDINYPDLQEGNLVGLEAYVLSTEASLEKDGTATLQVGNGVYSKQPDNLPSLGLAWDAQAKVQTEGDVGVQASATVDASIDDIKFADCIKGGMGIKAKGDAKLSVKKVIYTFKSSAEGKIIWDPIIGATSAEEQAPPTPAPGDGDLMSGVGGVAWHSMMLLGAFLPTILVVLSSTISAA